MTLDSVLVYSFVAEIFSEQLNCRANLEEAFWNGTAAMRYLQPMGLSEQLASEMVGGWAFNFLVVSIPLYLVAPLLGVNPLPVSASAGCLFLVSLILAVITGFSLDFIFWAAVIYLDSGIWILGGLRNTVGTLLSGAAIPLALLPWGIGNVFQWLPFASMASAPLRIYTGTGHAGELIAIQAFWALAIRMTASWIWKNNQELAVSYGG